jgi:hypothetical protein
MNTLNLFGSALWVVGLAIIITSLGWRLWKFRVGKSKLGVPLITIIRDEGALLFCLGVSLAVGQLWVTVLFAILASAFAIIAIIDLRSGSRVHL